MNPLRIAGGRLAAMTALTSCALFAVVACSDTDDRPAFGPDAGPDAPALPDPSQEDGAAPERDGGSDSFDASSEPVVCAVSPCAVELAAGAGHVCARMSDGDVWCWGDDALGATGNGKPEPGDKDDPKSEPEDTSRPVRVTDLANVSQISAANRTTCARRNDGAVLCWGGNEQGQLGLAVAPAISDSDAHPYRSVVELGSTATRVDVGERAACALLASGELACWGFNDKKQLARADADRVLGPGKSDLAGFVVTRTGGSEGSTYGLTGTGGLLSWGALAGREGSLNPDPVPALLPALSGVHDVAVGPTHACALSNGSVYCWGSSQKYALCTGLPTTERIPAHAHLQTTAYPQQIAVSRNNTCVRLTDGSLQCCGDATHGQLAVAPPDGGGSMFSFTRAEEFTGHAVQVVTTDISTCALLRSGAVECWGGNEHGELGRGTRDGDPHPTPAAVTFQ